MTDRARRIQRLRRRVAVGSVALFAAAFGTVAADGSMGTTTASTSTATAAEDSGTTTTTTTAEAPSAVTTRPS